MDQVTKILSPSQLTPKAQQQVYSYNTKFCLLIIYCHSIQISVEVEDYILSYTAPLSLTNQPLPVMVSTVDDDVFEEREEIVLTLVQSSYSNEGQILAWQTVVITVSDNDSKLPIIKSSKTLYTREISCHVSYYLAFLLVGLVHAFLNIPLLTT